ncbi:uncharacterized protein LOC118564027 [Fundulus heteroclitus]|uniref:uncharacterized protein LOC118564027 n=1 Tax=Fundulus heteroclitus TaxID=8078 RepID=UPI00165C7EFC|nr:uncharacterized protein LOC118564027 [Fundulus heteroclitus]
MLSDVREETFIVLIPHAETARRAEPWKAEMRWDTATELGDPPPFLKSLKDFIGETGQSTCTCSVGKNSLLTLYLTDPAEMAGLKLAAKISEVTTESAATERTAASQENVAVDTTEEAKPTATPSPALLEVTQTEATTAGPPTEATTATTQIQDTARVFGPSSAAVSQPSAGQWLTTLPDPEPEADTQPRFIKCVSVSTQATSKVQFSGLRMRDGESAAAAEPDKDGENDETGPEKWAAADRTHGLVHRGGEYETFPKSAEDARKEGADKDLETDLCRGLIDRTAAGWKHCEERRGAPPSRRETPDAGKPENGAKSGGNQNPLSDEDSHFYYFNGVLKRVDNAQFYRKRQRRSSRATEKGLTERQRQTQENLQRYIQRLVKKNEAEHFK